MKRIYLILITLFLAASNLFAFSISGNVYDNSEPQQAILKLYDQFPCMSAEPVQQIDSTEDGSYEFTLEVSGVYYVEAALLDNPNLGIFYENSLQPIAATPIHIHQTNPEVTDIDFDLALLPQANNSISGIVTGNNATVLTDATIKLFMLEPPNNPPMVTFSNENGYYEFVSLVDGEYLMQVHYLGYQPYFYDGAMGWPQADVIVLEDSTQVTIDPVLTAMNTNSVCGYVEDLQSGEALEGVEIYALRQNEQSNNLVPIPSAETNADGQYCLDLPAGFYLFYAQDPQSGEIQFYQDAESPLNAEWVLVNNDINSIDFVLDTSIDDNYSVSGKITVGNIPPITPILAVAVSSDEDWEDVTMTNSAGDYEFPSLPEGEYYIMAFSDQNTPTYYQNAIDFQEAELVTVDSDISNLNIDVEIPQETGYYEVSGYVSDQENQPVQNATVLFLDENGDVADFAFTNGLGAYNSPYLSGLNYTAIATKTFFTTDIELVAVLGNQSQDFVINPTQTSYNTNSIPENPLALKVYPNPFNPNTTISFSLSETASQVKLEIYNVKGQLVKSKIFPYLEAGSHHFTWNAKDAHGDSIASGVYLLKIATDKIVSTKKMLLLQ
jgi:hypothetical protein